jgi:uncharacterized peroxidase-related enzyme
MSHFPLVEYEAVSNPIVQEVYDEIKMQLGFGMVPNLFKSMASHPEFLAASWHKFRGVILQGELPRTHKEMVGVAISQANNSQYALQVHLHGLSALGMSEEVLRTLVTDFKKCPLPERQKAMIRFGLKAATQPHDLMAEDYQQLRDLGFDEAEIFEIIATANLFTGINQYTDAIQLEIDQL